MVANKVHKGTLQKNALFGYHVFFLKTVPSAMCGLRDRLIVAIKIVYAEGTIP